MFIALFAFCEMNNRPIRVAAQSVLLLLGARSFATTYEPVLSVPKNVPVSVGPPRGTQSPQGDVKVPKNSLQFASRNAWGPALSCVRHTCCKPTNHVPLTFGSLISGM